MRRRLFTCLLGLAIITPLHAEKPPPDEVKPEGPAKLKGTKPLPPLPAGAFTFVVIPDTQHYTGKGTKVSKGSGKQLEEPVKNAHLEAQVAWILANQKAQNIVFVSHVGDIVEYDRKPEWEVAKQHLDKLRGVVPFSLTVGNHDMSSKGDAHLFQETFPAASFKDYPWYAGAYAHERENQKVSANNVNSAQLFSAGGVDFIHLSLECNAPDDVLAWADGVLTKHADRRAIITTHMDLGILDKPKEEAGYIKDPKGRMKWVKIHGARGNTGEQMWDKLYRKHANLFLVLCGDQSRVTALKLDRAADDGHIIHGLLSDYMSEPALRLMRFLPAEKKIDVLTYEVKRGFLVEDTSHVHEVEQHQFSLSWDGK
ncbi:metallophosphoesterase [Brevifollis gellanilyticus]|uniref:Calcineurin-like phosphoesterase domain-containing protein n=1 Tax=Brevifollis gellanilyticus TaxID=748831 RepID=A0A512MHJ7_9BACT|nr:metallophosphoesterase [Brevifollis gellanilyticus]GEP46206.1 hypothetical protein BGE01nite_54970 [Brevifollis gellanilyticus]